MVSVISSVDTAHEDMIHDAQMDYYGIRLATCSSDRAVKIFDVKSGQQTLVADLRGNSGLHQSSQLNQFLEQVGGEIVEEAALNKKGGSRHQLLHAWDRAIGTLPCRPAQENGSKTAFPVRHEGPVWQVAWAHPMYGNILASCSYDRKVIVWKENAGTWEKFYEYSNHDSSVNSVQWAPHEFGLVLACASSDGTVSVLTHTDGKWDSQKIKDAHAIGCNAVSWAAAVEPGSLIEAPSAQKVTPSRRFVTGGCDNLVKIWKEENGEWKEEHKLEAHSDWVRDVAWAPSIGLPHSTIASCSQDGRVIIWTSDESSSSWTPKILHKFNDVVWHVSWSITGNILAVSSGDNKVGLWKESLEGQWVCVSNVNKGEGQSQSTTDVQPEQ